MLTRETTKKLCYNVSQWAPKPTFKRSKLLLGYKMNNNYLDQCHLPIQKEIEVLLFP